MLTVQNYISLGRWAFELSPFQRWCHYVLRLWNSKVSWYDAFPMGFKLEAFNRHCKGFHVFARLQLDEHTLKISKDLKAVVKSRLLYIPQSEDGTVKSKPKKGGNNTNEPNWCPKSTSNESNVAAVAKLVNEEQHISVWKVSVRHFFLVWNS